MSENQINSARALLSELIDYAGLFPPAALLMPEAVSNYADYRQGDFNWILGRFVVPVTRLDEFLESAKSFFPEDGAENVWKLSVLASEDIDETLRKIENFNVANAPRVVCDALELKAANAAKIIEAAAVLPDNLIAYFEIPLDGDLADLIAALAICGKRAKIRTGGVTTDAFPTAPQIICFMRTCLAANVPFKCTAGLHHPLRGANPLTYEKDAATGTMHGFLNVFLAAAYLKQGYQPNVIRELFEDDQAENFSFDESGVWWRREYFLSTAQIENLRRRGAISFGSCSFIEPVTDLISLNILHLSFIKNPNGMISVIAQ